jgi:uncharacterized protein YdeI (YjbR/CyaY-like superfamily)
MSTAPIHFRTAAEWRAWLARHHATARELTLLFYNRSSGRGGITYAEALDEALCHGWIDGLIRKVDATSHTRRFTPRRPGSIWSNVNVAHVERLQKAGRMRPAGEAAFAARTAHRTGVYSFEQRPEAWPRALAQQFRRNSVAWDFWQRQPPGYRRRAIWWVVSARQDATRIRRLAALIATCAAGRRLDQP